MLMKSVGRPWSVRGTAVGLCALSKRRQSAEISALGTLWRPFPAFTRISAREEKAASAGLILVGRTRGSGHEDKLDEVGRFGGNRHWRSGGRGLVLQQGLVVAGAAGIRAEAAETPGAFPTDVSSLVVGKPARWREAREFAVLCELRYCGRRCRVV